MEQNLKDGQRYLVTFNGGVDCVEAVLSNNNRQHG